MTHPRRLLAPALLLALGCRPSSRPADAPAPDLLGVLGRSVTSSQWSVIEAPTQYDRDTLYEYLDGGAERYIAHGFRTLAHVRVARFEGPRASVTIDVFDMGSPLGAFAIYRSIVPPEAPPRPWGTEGYSTGTVAAAWHGRVYVHAEADEGGAEAGEQAERMTREICAGLEGDGALPSMLAPLPTAGLVLRSERYEARDLLGHDFLPGGVRATYILEGRRGELFFSNVTSATAASAALARLRTHHARFGTVVGEVIGIGSSGFRFAGAGLGSGAVVRIGTHVAGVHGSLAEPEQDRLLVQLSGALGP